MTFHDRGVVMRDRFISVKQAGMKAKVTDRTIRRWIKAGILPATRTKTGRVLIRESDLFSVLNISESAIFEN